MHGVHAIQEWLILASFQPRYLRETPREGAAGANLRSGMGLMLRRFGWLPTRSMACRVEERSVFHQSGGAVAHRPRMARLAEYAALFRPTGECKRFRLPRCGGSGKSQEIGESKRKN